jgi:hypothetical protein
VGVLAMTASPSPPASLPPAWPSVPPLRPQGASTEPGPRLDVRRWIPDPFGRHQFRYADATGWTNAVSDNGVVTFEGASLVGPAARPRRRRRWIIAGIVAACLAGAGIIGIGVSGQYSIDTYTADLTQGSGDFRIFDNASWATFYRADGYHVVAKTPGFVMPVLAATGSHTALSVKVTVRAVTAPPGAAFGPLALAKPGGAGYWLSIDPAGTATLAEIDTNGHVWAIADAKAPPLGTGTTRTLMLTCVIGIDGSVHLGGYVDGKLVISGAPTVKISSVAATGMAGHAKATVPAEWVATWFGRLGSDDMPGNAPR